MGIILLALGLGVVCWIIFTVEGCMSDYKARRDMKVNATFKRGNSANKSVENRGAGGYSVVIK